MMTKYNLSELHETLKKILICFDKICIENNINYSIAYGTLLGAIREKGFIPWDDDIDVMMTRDEYNKLVNLKSDKFKIITGRESKNQGRVWIPRFILNDKENIESNFLDIFIFDNVSDNIIAERLKIFIIKALQGSLKDWRHVGLKNYSISNKINSLITYTAGLFFTTNFKLKLYDRISERDNMKTTKYMGCYRNVIWYLHVKIPRLSFSEYERVPFEDISLNALKGYDSYLKAYYGDYMKRPPLEEQKPAHGNI